MRLSLKERRTRGLVPGCVQEIRGISLVLCEMWDTTAVNPKPFDDPELLDGKTSTKLPTLEKCGLICVRSPRKSSLMKRLSLLVCLLGGLLILPARAQAPAPAPAPSPAANPAPPATPSGGQVHGTAEPCTASTPIDLQVTVRFKFLTAVACPVYRRAAAGAPSSCWSHPGS